MRLAVAPGAASSRARSPAASSTRPPPAWHLRSRVHLCFLPGLAPGRREWLCSVGSSRAPPTLPLSIFTKPAQLRSCQVLQEGLQQAAPRPAVWRGGWAHAPGSISQHLPSRSWDLGEVSRPLRASVSRLSNWEKNSTCHHPPSLPLSWCC